MRKNRNLLIVLILVISISTLVPVFARYVKEINSKVNIQSDKFYFTVDLLGDTNTDESLEKTYYFYGGDTKEVTFSIQNYFDDFRISECDVKYSISTKVELPTGSSYDPSNVTIDHIGYSTLAKNVKNSHECTLKVLEGYDNETKVTVQITSTKPYVKTMKLTFVLMTFDSEASYYIIDSVDSLYAELIVTTNVTIDVASLLIDFSSINELSNILQVDMTNIYLIDEGGILNQIEIGEEYLKKVTNTLVINIGEAISIKFFKSDIEKDYSISNTKLTGTIVDGKKIYIVTLSDNE